MKELLILSGKGGTGKTTITSAFIKIAKAKTYADCDVDAPNLHLVREKKSEPKTRDYYGLERALIKTDKCTDCDLCRQACRFDAIFIDGDYKVDPYLCEGCGVCEFLCPENAIKMEDYVDGHLMLYKDGDQVFSTAQLKMGSGTSGLLVTEVKKEMKREAIAGDFAIIDGSPGIGCPVIASIAGVDMILIVAEPSISGISDMKRIIETARRFSPKIGICINKYDTNLEKTEEIVEFSKAEGLELLGKIAFDFKAVEAINNGKTIVDIDCISGRATKELYKKTVKMLLKEDGSFDF